MFFENKKMELIWQIPQISLKVCHSEGFAPKNPFYLDTSPTLRMTLFWNFWVELAI